MTTRRKLKLPAILRDPKLKARRDALIDALDLSRTTQLAADQGGHVIVHRTARAGPGAVQVTYFKGGQPKGHFFARSASEVVKRAWARLGPLRIDRTA